MLNHPSYCFKSLRSPMTLTVTNVFFFVKSCKKCEIDRQQTITKTCMYTKADVQYLNLSHGEVIPLFLITSLSCLKLLCSIKNHTRFVKSRKSSYCCRLLPLICAVFIYAAVRSKRFSEDNGNVYYNFTSKT